MSKTGFWSFLTRRRKAKNTNRNRQAKTPYTLLCPIEAQDITGYNHVRI